MRPAFGGKALWKVSLGTKSAADANILFLQANAALEQRFEDIRARIRATGSPTPTQRDQAGDMVSAYFQGPERTTGGLDGPERLLLARFEIDRGLWNMTPTGCSTVAPSDPDRWWALANNAALFRDHGGTHNPPEGHAPGSIWRWSDDAFRADAKAIQIARLVEQIARHHDMPRADLPAPVAEAAIAFLDATPVDASMTRKRRNVAGRLRPDLRLMDLFEDWKLVMQPSLQTAHEYQASARDFVDFLGDISVEEIEQNDLLDYRDEAANCPQRCRRPIGRCPSRRGFSGIATPMRRESARRRSKSGSVPSRRC